MMSNGIVDAKLIYKQCYCRLHWLYIEDPVTALFALFCMLLSFAHTVISVRASQAGYIPVWCIFYDAWVVEYAHTPIITGRDHKLAICT